VSAADEDPETLRSQATDWFVRVQSDVADEQDWLALEAWLSGSPARRAAFEQVELLWSELDAHPDLSRQADEAAAPVVVPFVRPAQRQQRAIAWPVWGAAAGLVVAALFGWRLWSEGPPAQLFTTAKGETRTILLADGSHVDLSSGSSLTARVDRRRREVVLEQGEALFDVAKDPAHPFKVTVGDQQVTVVGTQFDILRYGGDVTVTVSRGAVRVRSVNPGAGETAATLAPGDQLRHREGTSASVVAKVPVQDVLAWRQGYLVYRDGTLAQVAADLSRFFPTPIQADGPAARLRFSGVLRLDDEESVLRRLTSFVPIEAVRDRGRIHLRSSSSHG
jgi:transmembrane sensor